MTGKINSFNKEECFNMSNQDIMDAHKEQFFKKNVEEKNWNCYALATSLKMIA